MDTEPQIAGGYLTTAIRCDFELVKWLGIDKGLISQDNEIRIVVHHDYPEECA